MLSGEINFTDASWPVHARPAGGLRRSCGMNARAEATPTSNTQNPVPSSALTGRGVVMVTEEQSPVTLRQEVTTIITFRLYECSGSVCLAGNKMCLRPKIFHNIILCFITILCGAQKIKYKAHFIQVPADRRLLGKLRRQKHRK